MAEKIPEGRQPSPYAKRLDPKQDGLTPEQVQYMRKMEIAQWHKSLSKRQGRNVITGLIIGAIVVGIYGYTFYSVSQEKFMDELEEEAKVARASLPKTSAN